LLAPLAEPVAGVAGVAVRVAAAVAAAMVVARVTQVVAAAARPEWRTPRGFVCAGRHFAAQC